MDSEQAIDAIIELIKQGDPNVRSEVDDILYEYHRWCRDDEEGLTRPILP